MHDEPLMERVETIETADEFVEVFLAVSEAYGTRIPPAFALALERMGAEL